jgi:hypothetical protein
LFAVRSVHHVGHSNKNQAESLAGPFGSLCVLLLIFLMPCTYTNYAIFVQYFNRLLDDLKDRRGYSHLKEEALNLAMWRNRFGGGFEPVVRQNTE